MTRAVASKELKERIMDGDVDLKCVHAKKRKSRYAIKFTKITFSIVENGTKVSFFDDESELVSVMTEHAPLKCGETFTIECGGKSPAFSGEVYVYAII